MYPPVGVEVIQACGVGSPPGEEGHAARGAHCLLLGSRSRGNCPQRKTCWELNVTRQPPESSANSWTAESCGSQSQPVGCGPLLLREVNPPGEREGRTQPLKPGEDCVLLLQDTVSREHTAGKGPRAGPVRGSGSCATMASCLALAQGQSADLRVALCGTPSFSALDNPFPREESCSGPS